MSLLDRIASKSQPLEPIKTDQVAQYNSLRDIRKIVFDVYGTLLVSGVGDISMTQLKNRGDAIMGSLEACGLKTGSSPETLASYFVSEIEASQRESRKKGMSYPEVDICRIWERVLTLAGIKEKQTTKDLQELAIVYECSVNPVWPMPEMVSCLKKLSSQYGSLGIVSNAQFFTPLLFQALTGASLEQLGFSDKLCIWSYQEGAAKPSTILFEKVLQRMESEIDAPSQVLYLGNDMRNDIATASACGLRTALFAGDQRSLRLRKEDPFCRGVKPDWIVTSLTQFVEFCSKHLDSK